MSTAQASDGFIHIVLIQHKAFRAKAAAALQDPTAVSQQDWEGLRLILDAIMTAFTA